MCVTVHGHITFRLSARHSTLVSTPPPLCYTHLRPTELQPYVLYLVELLILCLMPLWVVISSKHPASHILLRTGWEPIITAMVISRLSPISTIIPAAADCFSWWLRSLPARSPCS
ncbi:unnamed protein product [Pleuronectes platessa]|uniref:Uncharacterized protein n=1 Tax=Pleuronectes platessa TaxID=8262 RepID=A0A9N7YNV6_PLEPL|nr:unnamed protein product [Pleuronectes platessa]